MKKIITVVGARPQFVKAAALNRAMARRAEDEIDHFLLHTGQHYDDNMSKVFFRELELPDADMNLGIAGATHGAMTGAMLAGIESVLSDHMSRLLMCPMVTAVENLRAKDIKSSVQIENEDNRVEAKELSSMPAWNFSLDYRTHEALRLNPEQVLAKQNGSRYAMHGNCSSSDIASRHGEQTGRICCPVRQGAIRGLSCPVHEIIHPRLETGL